MGWHYSNGGGVGYAYSQLNSYNQHCAAITGLTPGTAIIKLKVKAAGYTGSVSTRLVAWGVGGNAVSQSSTFTMADGSTSTQYTYEKSVNSHVMSGTTIWVGLYRNPAGSHVMETDSGSGDGYRKTNTTSFPSVISMSGYNTDSNDEPYVGVFMIASPNDPTSAAVSRNSDTSQTITWTRNASDDRPVYTQYLERYDNVTGSWYVIKTYTTDYTSNGNHSYTDTTTVANRQYRYRMRSHNDAGYSDYDYTDYIHTTPAAPTNVVATRIGSNVKITWTDNSYQEDLFRIQSRESTDGGETWGAWGDVDTVLTSTEEYTDTSPYTYGQYRVQAEEGTYNSPTLLSGYTESNEVVTLAAPDAPTGLNPDDITYDSETDNRTFSWNHNDTDGTDQTKFSLKIKKSGGTYPKEIDNFADYSEWTASGSDLADDETNIIDGLGNSVSMSDSDDTGSTISMYKTISSIDLTEFDDASVSTTSDLISLLVYISDVSYYSDLTLKLGDDNTDNYSTSVDPSATLSNGWNRIDVAKSAFDTNGSPTGWDDITYIRIDATTENNASGENISVQYLQLALVTDFTSYAGDFFVQYHEIESVSEALSIIANSFVNGYSYDWQVKTWGEYSTGSDYSDIATFSTTTTPVATITDPSAVSNYGYSSLELDWTYTQAESNSQVQYLAKLYDSDDLLLESKQVNSVIAAGNNDTCIFDYQLENATTYTVTLQVQESNELWSELSEVEFTTEFLQTTKPTIDVSLNENDGSIDIGITNPDVVVDYNEESSQDTYVDNDNSGVNYDESDLQLENDTDSGTTIKTILLDFDTSFFVDKTIVSADLQLYRKTALVPGIDSKVNYIKTSWDETTVTYGTLPTLDTTDYDDHTHSSGISETWDITSLLSDIADGTITDFEGIAIVATTIDGSTDEFYDNTNDGYEPVMIVEISPLNADTDYNQLYRSINGGSFELIEDQIPVNTTVTDHIPTVGGNNNYYVKSISSTPSSNNSDESDLDVLLTGMFFFNGGNNFENVVRLVGDTSYNENIGRDETIKQYAGRTYPVKYQGNSKIQKISFSGDCPFTKYDDLVEIIENVGDLFYRDWHGRWFYAYLDNQKFDNKDAQAYQFSTNITRLNGGVE